MGGYRLGFEENQKRSKIKNLEIPIRYAQLEIDLPEGQISNGDIDKDDADRTRQRNRRDIADWDCKIGRNEAELEQITRCVEDFTADLANLGL